MSLPKRQCTKWPLSYQRGAATLIVTMVFLFSTSIVMLYLNRNILFEQKTSVNQMRSTKALEMAEAGIEWATGMLNAPYDIGTDCEFITPSDPSKKSFMKTYVQTTSSDVSPSSAMPGCKIDEDTMINPASGTPTASTKTCNCPASGTAVLTGAQPGFTVSFAVADAADPEAVLVTATGCTAQTGACTTTSSATADATATVRVVLKMRPLLRAAPASPLTCGTTCAVGGSYNIVNQDVATGGILVNAGSAITSGSGTSYTSIPGQPVVNALVPNDSSLSALVGSDPTTCAGSSVFSAYFGSSIDQYAASPLTKTIANCGSANTCGDLVDEAFANNWRSFYFPDGFARNSSSGNLGTQDDPVTLVSAAGFNLNGNIDIYGMIFSNSANVNDLGTGTANIHGALVTCAGYNNNGNGTLEYDATVLKGVRRSSGIFVRVPGSWLDQ